MFSVREKNNCTSLCEPYGLATKNGKKSGLDTFFLDVFLKPFIMNLINFLKIRLPVGPERSKRWFW